ncbi:hypothetical protein FF38_04862 [Lucilia cuprina]|uniref:Uncharacterized protein n=1 Tax=Lucilia cuprina TaxID=7375 RepID=A0A0L0BXK0_LUCCU|nr:hypothetical protein FF38_04862 [Lucilia cuprina]
MGGFTELTLLSSSRSEPCRANSSAISLPCMSQCPGTQHSLIVLCSFLCEIYTVGGNGHIGKNGLAFIAEARSFNSSYLEADLQTVDNQSAQAFTINIFGNNDQRFALLFGQFKGGNDALNRGDLLFRQKQQGVLEFNLGTHGGIDDTTNHYKNW